MPVLWRVGEGKAQGWELRDRPEAPAEAQGREEEWRCWRGGKWTTFRKVLEVKLTALAEGLNMEGCEEEKKRSESQLCWRYP